MFTLICVRINGWANNGEAGDLRRYFAHYDVIVMCIYELVYSVISDRVHNHNIHRRNTYTHNQRIKNNGNNAGDNDKILETHFSYDAPHAWVHKITVCCLCKNKIFMWVQTASLKRINMAVSKWTIYKYWYIETIQCICKPIPKNMHPNIHFCLYIYIYVKYRYARMRTWTSS